MDKQQQKKIITEIMDADAKDGLYETWEDIEQEYLKDEYPVFGGPFTDALKPFEWLNKYYHSPIRKQDDYKKKSTKSVTNSHKLTAVEWLIEQYVKDGLFKQGIYEQAKAIEKKQIEKAFVEGGVQYMANIGDDIPPKAKDYYNKKYKK